MLGHLVGKPIIYTSSNKEMMKEIQDIFNYNDEQDENSGISQDVGHSRAGHMK